MARALAIVAALPLALALAACSVDVEGAPCAIPGETTDCPSGQACGNDRTCSERAAACASPLARCTPGQTLCAGGDGTVFAKRCTDADPVCGTWEADDCGLRGLVCGYNSPNGAASCECPPGFTGPEFAADPVAGSPAGTTPFPTGAASPDECRFKRLGDGVARAAEVTAPGGVVQVYAADGAQAVFGAASGDGPITIPANVVVKAAPQPAGTTIFAPTAASDETLVTLAGTIEGFRIENGTGDAIGVATSCVGAGRPTLSGVVIDGGAALTAGIDVSGSCGADLTGVEVSNVSGPALRIHADASAQVNVSGGSLNGSTVGARVTSGKATFGSETDATKGVEFSGNAAEGLVITIGAAADVRLYSATIHGNGGTGVSVDRMSSGSALTLRGCDIYSNGTGTPRSYGPSGSQRPAGGMLVVQGALPSFTFLANRLYANTGDQLAFESTGSWTIGPDSCGATSNLFTCVTPGAYAVGIAAGGTVDPRNTVWPEVPFTEYVSANVTGSWCNGVAGVPQTPVCSIP